ncbi:MAG: hypothetical protein JSR15_12065, partial [Proteobacteria bacterium]|nr:hypothetical protein [Pseudomonadota bacterium]
MDEHRIGDSIARWRRLLGCGALLLFAALPITLPAADANGNTLLPAPARSDNFLPPDVAFKLAATAESPDRVRLSWAIVPGYYLYQSRLKFATTSAGMTLGAAELPAGDTKNDEYFGKQVVYHNGLIAHLPVAHAAGTTALKLSVTYQGCAEAGLCYPPITKQFDLMLPAHAAAAGAGGIDAAGGTGGASANAAGNAGSGAFVSEQDRLARMIRTGSLAGIIATFFGLGLLLAFTPCVLPMVPILSG